jgi:hypothetical protein
MTDLLHGQYCRSYEAFQCHRSPGMSPESSAGWDDA